PRRSGCGLLSWRLPSGCASGALLRSRRGVCVRRLRHERDLLGDFGELVFERMVGGVGPFARPVRLAAAEDEAESFGRGVVAAGDPDPGVLRGGGEFLLGGDVLGPVLLLQDEKPHGLALCGDAETGRRAAAAMRWRRKVGLSG